MELANKRVMRATESLKVLGNLSKLELSRDAMSEADVATIMNAIDSQVTDTRRRLLGAATGQQLDVEFDLEAR